MGICKEKAPDFTQVSESHKAACWLHHPMAKKVLGVEEIKEVFQDE